MKRLTFTRLLTLAERFSTSSHRILLDIGCAVGFLMAEANSRHWDSYGIEMSEYAAEKAQERFPGHVFKGTLEDRPFPGIQFDMITMIDLLEHAVHPAKILSLSHERLNPNGLVVIGTPDLESVSAKVCRGSWEHIKHEHLYYFTRSSLALLLRKNGFEPLSVTPHRKSLTLQYVNEQLQAYPLPFISKGMAWSMAVLPLKLQRWNFSATVGEMLVIARKI